MIVRVKTQSESVKNFAGKLAGYDATKDIYEILPQELMNFLTSAYQSGIKDFQLSINESDVDKIKYQNEKNISKKTISMWYLEDKLEDEIAEFKENKDIERFFESIGFNDEDNVAKDVCEYIMENVTKDDMYVNYKGRVYSLVFSWKFGFSARKKRNILRKQINQWTEEYQNGFINQFGTCVPYVLFIQILLKYLGYPYY